jgi:TonB family protein
VSMGLAKQAVLYTLVVHVIVLGAMLVWPVSETQPPSEVFAEVDMVGEVLDEPSQSYEDALKQSLQEKVANLRANAESALSEEAKSSQVADESELEAMVEADLRAMEAAEFERLAAEEKEFETAGEADVTRQDVQQTFEQWDAQYDGAVTVRYNLEGRTGRDLDVPGYTCEGGAQVEVLIEVNPSGRVVSASLISGEEESCFGLAALRSARRARFNVSSKAPAKQQGRLTYLFVAQ